MPLISMHISVDRAYGRIGGPVSRAMCAMRAARTARTVVHTSIATVRDTRDRIRLDHFGALVKFLLHVMNSQFSVLIIGMGKTEGCCWRR